MTDRSLRVALVNDHEIVLRGLAGMLAPYADRLRIVELTTDPDVADLVDIALFDTYGRAGLGLVKLADLVADPSVRHVAVFTAATNAALAQRALEVGASGFLPKSLPAADLANCLVRVGHGETVVITEQVRKRRQLGVTWPGQGRGLTERESELLSLVAIGMRNDEIAQALFVSANTVKSHLKSVFRKLEVRNRTEAIAAVTADPSFIRRAAVAGTPDGPESAAAG